MAHRELLTEPQRLSFHAPASDERGMVRYYTLSAEDLALVNRRRGDPNRLGLAVMRCSNCGKKRWSLRAFPPKKPRGYSSLSR